MTTAHRSSPIPQLKCLGGSAQCSFTPQTVQCYNKGSDGYDVQVTYFTVISSGTGISTPRMQRTRLSKVKIQSVKCDSIVSGLNYTDVH